MVHNGRGFNNGRKMVECMHVQCMREWGKGWQEWRVNNHNDGFSHINLHAPRLILGSPRARSFPKKELRIIVFDV
jgi:hypothetical protein